MEWIKCVIRVPGFIGGGAVRQYLARFGFFPAAFFHHEDDGGGPIPGPPAIRMFANDYIVTVLGVGEQGRELLLSHLGHIMRAFGGRRAGISTGEFRIVPLRQELIWNVRSCVLNIPRQYLDFLREGRFREVDEVLTSVFGRALRRQVRLLCPGMRAQVAVTPIRVAGYRSVAVEKAAGRYYPAVDCLVRMPFRLIGPWQFGLLQARGYGRCRPARTLDFGCNHEQNVEDNL